VCASILNDWLLPPFLFFLEVGISIFFCYQPQQKKVFQINSSLGKKYKAKRKENRRLRDRIIILKFSNYLQRFDRYKTYQLCMILGVNYKFRKQYKSLEIVKAEIKQVFYRCPREVLAAMAIVNSGNHC